MSRGCKGGHSCLSPDLRGKQSFIIEYDVNCRFLLFLFFNAFYMIEEVSSSLSFQRASIMNGHGSLSNAFSASIEMIG